MLPSKPLLLIYHQHLAAPDGTSVQLVRLLEDAAWSIIHVHGQTARRGALAIANYRSLCTPTSLPWLPRRGYYSLLHRWHRYITPGIARWLRFTSGREARLAHTAYVIVYSEDQALFARAVLGAWGSPRYVLHLMDLLSDSLGPAITPGLLALLGGAANVLVTSPRLGEAVAPWCQSAPIVFPLTTGLDSRPPPAAAHRLPRLIMCGGLYATEPHRTAFLRGPMLEGWRRFSAEFPAPRWVYAGADASGLGELAAHVTPLGRLDDAAYADALRTARCALVPVVHQADEPWRYSVPSRLVDFLAAGLPALMPTTPGTAADDFAARHAAHGIERVATAEDVYAALRRLFTDDAYYHVQASAAYVGAQEHALGTVRALLKATLTA